MDIGGYPGSGWEGGEVDIGGYPGSGWEGGEVDIEDRVTQHLWIQADSITRILAERYSSNC